ncbi:hypothetical protein [Actinokineospora globicatena]|uniref:hypothetical protein n=1 Tax=Actinokineospora globicatena TaxID=103729 RepID=UPI0020A60887|nr:hypothetical protein [Actinokineospora globicatena]
MARSSSDTAIQDAFTAADLTRHQRALLHHTLRALDPGSALGFHASTTDSALAALIRAHDALDNHAAHEQPQRPLLLRVLRTSALCLRAALPIFPPRTGRPHLRAAITELTTTTTALSDAEPAHHRALARHSATTLEPLITAITDAITDHLRTLWDTTTGDPTRDTRAAAEIAVSVYLRGRDGEALKNDLTALLTTRTPTADDIAALLWPPPRRHHLTALVSGARHLTDSTTCSPAPASGPSPSTTPAPDPPRTPRSWPPSPPSPARAPSSRSPSTPPTSAPPPSSAAAPSARHSTSTSRATASPTSPSPAPTTTRSSAHPPARASTAPPRCHPPGPRHCAPPCASPTSPPRSRPPWPAPP